MVKDPYERVNLYDSTDEEITEKKVHGIFMYIYMQYYYNTSLCYIKMFI